MPALFLGGKDQLITKLKKLTLNLLLSIISIVFAFLMIEGGLRLIGYYPRVLIPPYLFENHSKTWWALRPNFDDTISTPDGVVTYAINSQGIRAPYDFAKDNSAAQKRLFIIGDSFTFGWGVDEEYTFPRLINNRFRAQNISVEVVNLGVSGFGTRHSYERLLEYSELLGQPGLVIYVFSTNDPVDNIAGQKEVVDGIRIDAHRNNKWLLAKLGHAYYRSHTLSLVIDFYYSNFGNPRVLKEQEMKEVGGNIEEREDFRATSEYLFKMISWAEENDVEFGVVTIAHSEYSEPIKKIMDGKGLPMIEADEIFSSLNVNNESLVLTDGHWNKNGLRLIAIGIEEFLFEQGWIEH